jgi:probable addiction module antidote protein
MVAYLEAALEENDSRLIAAALGDIARAKGMTRIAQKTGLGRGDLYKAFVGGRQPGICHRAESYRSIGITIVGGETRKVV